MSIGHWIIVLVIVLLVFGTRRFTSGLSGGARDVGKAINEFKKGMNGEEETQTPPEKKSDDTPSNTP